MNHPWDQSRQNRHRENGPDEIHDTHFRAHPGAASVEYVGGGYPPMAHPPVYHYAAKYRLPLPEYRVAAFVLGLLSLLCFGAGFILGPLAVWMGSKGMREVTMGRARKDGLLTAGYVLGIISSVIWAVIVGLMLAGLVLSLV